MPLGQFLCEFLGADKRWLLATKAWNFELKIVVATTGASGEFFLSHYSVHATQGLRRGYGSDVKIAEFFKKMDNGNKT